MHSGAAISGSGESFKSGYKHQNWHEYSMWATLRKKTLADQNVKMAAIFSRWLPFPAL